MKCRCKYCRKIRKLIKKDNHFAESRIEKKMTPKNKKIYKMLEYDNMISERRQKGGGYPRLRILSEMYRDLLIENFMGMCCWHKDYGTCPIYKWCPM